MDRPVGLFLAGVQKCGTTSLFAYLRAHGGLWAPRVKETHHFDDEGLDWSRDDAAHLNAGHLHARYEPGGGDRLPFEATPITLFWPPSLPRIRAYNPDARFLLVFRDPIERAYSHWRMEARRGTEPLPFAEAIREGRARLPADDPLAGDWRDRTYVERGFYGRQLARAFDLFPPERFLLLDARDLDRDHPRVLARIAAFLGLSPFPPLPRIREHGTPPTPALPPVSREDHAHLREVYARDLERFAGLSGLDVSGWWTRRSYEDGSART